MAAPAQAIERERSRQAAPSGNGRTQLACWAKMRAAAAVVRERTCQVARIAGQPQPDRPLVP